MNTWTPDAIGKALEVSGRAAILATALNSHAAVVDALAACRRLLGECECSPMTRQRAVERAVKEADAALASARA